MRLSIITRPRDYCAISLLASTIAVIITAAACSAKSTGSEGARPASMTAPPSEAGQAEPRAAGRGLKVVATNSLIADWARRVGGGRVEVMSLVPPGADPHSFQPGPRDAVEVAGAEMVFGVGLGLEGAWLDELVKNAAANSSKVVALGEVVEPVDLVATDGQAGTLTEGRGTPDPHFWSDPLRAKLAVSQIAARLSDLDPAAGDAYRDNALAYNRELDSLHAWIQQEVGALPPERRLLVTSHDSLHYFASRYGFRVVGAVVPGLTTEVEPSAEKLAALVERIRLLGVRAVFTETTVSDRMARAIASETGAKLVNALHTGSLGGPGSGAESYTEVMRTNVGEIVRALR